MLDIVNLGLKNPVYSTCAMAEVLLQVYESDHLAVEIVDDFSWLYRKTVHKNYKYYNDSQLFGSIPPYHLAHVRHFVNLDGHKLKRGLKVVASSIGNLYTHHFDIKKIMLPVGMYAFIQNTNIVCQTSPLRNFWGLVVTTSSLDIGKPTKSSAKILFICTLFARVIGWTLFELPRLDITIDHWLICQFSSNKDELLLNKIDDKYICC